MIDAVPKLLYHVPPMARHPYYIPSTNFATSKDVTKILSLLLLQGSKFNMKTTLDSWLRKLLVAFLKVQCRPILMVAVQKIVAAVFFIRTPSLKTTIKQHTCPVFRSELNAISVGLDDITSYDSNFD
ncbi:hypothetical protein TNCV_1574151 [Trichonephila clavipes]|nr:hypothetical protein TNCV_1574151 [Trichonephila clavipes]